MEAALVLLIELDAVVEFTDDVCLVLSPHSLCFLTTNVGLTGCDHLVSDLEKRVYNTNLLKSITKLLKLFIKA